MVGVTRCPPDVRQEVRQFIKLWRVSHRLGVLTDIVHEMYPPLNALVQATARPSATWPWHSMEATQFYAHITASPLPDAAQAIIRDDAWWTAWVTHEWRDTYVSARLEGAAQRTYSRLRPQLAAIFQEILTSSG